MSEGLFGALGSGDSSNRGDGPGEMGAALPAVDLGSSPAPQLRADYRFLRFRPSRPEMVDGHPVLPHIRLDRALQFLLGDKME